MKSTTLLMSLAIASAAMSTSAFADDFSTTNVQADLQAYHQSGLASFWHGDDVTPNEGSPEYRAAEQRYNTLRGKPASVAVASRKEVKADLKAYQESGLADMTAGNRDVDEFSPQYQHALNKYNQLRSQM